MARDQIERVNRAVRLPEFPMVEGVVLLGRCRWSPWQSVLLESFSGIAVLQPHIKPALNQRINHRIVIMTATIGSSRIVGPATRITRATSMYTVVAAASALLGLYLTIYLVLKPFPPVLHAFHFCLHLYAYIRPRIAAHRCTRQRRRFRLQLLLADIWFVFYTTIYVARPVCECWPLSDACWYREVVIHSIPSLPSYVGYNRQASAMLWQVRPSNGYSALRLLHVICVLWTYRLFRNYINSEQTPYRISLRTQVLCAVYTASWLGAGLVEPNR